MNEITFELTDYCPHECDYCSSDATTNFEDATFLDKEKIEETLEHKKYDRIILSGGEPLSHPKFYSILQLCKVHTDDVVVYSNEITHLVYNANVIDGVYLEANITLPDETDKMHILKRVKQGREAERPEVKYSENWEEDCTCDDRVVRPDGKKTRHPCDKYKEVNEDE